MVGLGLSTEAQPNLAVKAAVHCLLCWGLAPVIILNATHILAFEGDSQVYWFEGNFSEYGENKKARLGEDSVVPQRVRYRQLTRG